jgi:TatD DNase family protein
MLIDSHAHLDLGEFDADRAKVIQRAFDAGVERIVNVGFEPGSWRATIEIADRTPEIYMALGMHPNEALKLNDETLAELTQLLRLPRVVAVGEIGLDYYRDRAPREVQQDVFRRQLALARQLELPVAIHSRDAHDDTLAILREQGRTVAGAMHCFSGDMAYAEACLELGLYISISGTVTFPNARMLQEVVRQVPLERLLVETDCPFMSPQPFRGKRNEPARVELVARAVADLKGVTFETVARATTENAQMLFGIK